MEPIPETARAIADFGPFVVEDDDLLAELLDKSRQAQVLVPECLGLSLASNRDEVTFTLVATAQEIALLDAVQYVVGGPCVEAVEAEPEAAYDQAQLLDEHGWQLFAQATASASASASVSSTLTLPILEGARVVGSINLYASTPTAFDGHHEAVARVFDAWAPGAVTNADLSFTTRDVAATAPDVLRRDIDLTVAAGLIARQDHVSQDEGRRRLGEAARRAGVGEVLLAQTIIELRRLQDTE